jgi:hypothetical protein
MRKLLTKMIRRISASLILGALIMIGPLQAQEEKSKHSIYMGGGVGMSLVAKNQHEQSYGDIGPSYSIFFGVHLSANNSLQLEYIVSHPNDDVPQMTDIIVTKLIHDGIEDYLFTTVRSPKMFQTRLLLLSFHRAIFRDFFYRIGIGLGSNDFAIYNTSKDAVLAAKRARDNGYALGLTGGYERNISDRLSLAIEASVRWSSGEDSTSARLVFGLGTVVKWDF